MKYGCIAERLGHSFSADIHALLGNPDYELCPLPPDALEDFLRQRDFCGINVTIPYKGAVIPYLDRVEETAARIGAVNTVVNKGGMLCGYNTDLYGMTALIRRLNIDLRGQKVAVTGTGGTSRTAVAVAESLGAREILRVGRTGRDDSITYEQLRNRHTDITFLINTTPVGMYPHAEDRLLELSCFPALRGVVDAVYNPLRTNLVLDARERGIPAEGGLYMLVAQAVRASELFLDTVYPDGTTDEVYKKMLAGRENIVLTGMPASGKSTIGRRLAARLGRRFLDADTCIEAHGRSIPAVFAAEGESGFRELESQVIRAELAPLTGVVIATGGGSILREENVLALRQNGRLFFLDRPPELLTPTADRPLASDREAIHRRYEERFPRYVETADCRVEASGDIDEVTEAVLKEWSS